MFEPISKDIFYPDRFKGKVMIITGASNGMGRTLALRAAKEGASLALADIDIEKGNRMVAELTDLGVPCFFKKTDITFVPDVQELIQETISRFGKLDILINNAGVMDGGGNATPAPCHLVEEGDYLRKTMEVNFFGTFHCCREALKQFIKQGLGGVIINISSITGVLGSPGTPVYVASKHAVNGLTKSIAIDYAPYGIRCNSINMPSTETPMYARAVDNVLNKRKTEGDDPLHSSNMVRPGLKMKGLIERISSPEEQAAMILYAASPEATYLTGSIILNDGGWSAF